VPDIQPLSLPFREAIAFFRQKVSLPTQRWNDLWEGMHARAFVIAGATKADLLSDLRTSIDKAISQGTTLEQFRKDFDQIVATHGWSYRGERNWRTDVMLNTNIRTAYAAGRYQQMTDPDVLRSRPFWQYKHGDSRHPRPLHLSWDGKVLRADDPWWETHYPPNGWRCSCKVFALSRGDMRRMGKDGPDEAPNDGTYQWTDKQTGEMHTIPRGIDPGWGYNVGEAGWGRPIAKKIIDEQAGGKWVDLPGKRPADYGRPMAIPIDKPRVTIGRRVGTESELRTEFRRAIGGNEKYFRDPFGDYVLASQAIVDHMVEDPRRIDGREAYFPFIPELIEEPYEVWAGFAQNELTKKVSIRRRYIKAVAVKKLRVLGLVADVVSGIWTSLTIFQRDRIGGLDTLRKGVLIWGRQ